MYKFQKITTVLTLCSFLIFSILTTSCSTKGQTGTLAGALVGATVGSKVGKGHGRSVAIFLGAVIGSQIGKAIGDHMDEHDRTQTAYILEKNKTYERSTWRNPDTGLLYSVEPTRTTPTATGPCREFTLDAQIGGEDEQLYGTACRQADGSWKMIE